MSDVPSNLSGNWIDEMLAGSSVARYQLFMHGLHSQPINYQLLVLPVTYENCYVHVEKAEIDLKRRLTLVTLKTLILNSDVIRHPDLEFRWPIDQFNVAISYLLVTTQNLLKLALECIDNLEGTLLSKPFTFPLSSDEVHLTAGKYYCVANGNILDAELVNRKDHEFQYSASEKPKNFSLCT